MGLKAMIWAKDTLVYLFFTGLIGCALTVALSWVSVLRDAVTKDED
ncbi:MAG TPA: hypothetical protein VKB38_16115 [Terracidiphilus sp.]|nr:hypothetical protein [Terracidiphilus sp.]